MRTRTLPSIVCALANVIFAGCGDSNKRPNGSGIWFLLEKRDGEWRIVEQKMAWVS